MAGRALPSTELGEALLPKRLALPIFASDPLSSVAYATQESLPVLTLGGPAYLHFMPWIAAGVVAMMTVVVLSYRQVVYACPSGGGSFEVVSANLGSGAGLVVGAALMVDYVMTVALLAVVNLRGVRESGQAFTAPTCLLVTGVLIMIMTGLFRYRVGDAPVAESAAYGIRPEEGGTQPAGPAWRPSPTGFPPFAGPSRATRRPRWPRWG